MLGVPAGTTVTGELEEAPALVTWPPSKERGSWRDVGGVLPAGCPHVPIGRRLPVRLPALPQQRVLPGHHPRLHLHLRPGLRRPGLRLR